MGPAYRRPTTLERAGSILRPGTGALAAAARAGDEAARMLSARAKDRSRLRGATAEAFLKRARALAGLREEPKFLLVRVFDAVRTELLAVGRHLADTGVLPDRDAVFFLTFAEARSALALAQPSRNHSVPADDGARRLRAVVARRRADYAREMHRRRVPRVLLSDGTEPEAALGAGTAGGPREPGILRGVPASAGTVAAAARVVLDPGNASLLPGEVLVAPSTDPGWTAAPGRCGCPRALRRCP